jgi:NAD(P)-dependent dehydrogenase (short-subunit alcohol dehydrogenase family)
MPATPAAIVTGAARGIGRAHALELAAQGYAVVVNDRAEATDGGPPPADLVVTEIQQAGGAAVSSAHDVADFGAAEQLVQLALDSFGRLDTVITNAGFLRDRMMVGMTEAEWDDVIAVHLKGTFAVAHHAAAYWRAESKAGRPVAASLITTSSASGIYGNVGQANYGAAKAGIAAFTVITAMELAQYGVTVNCLAPSALTRLTEASLLALEGEITSERREELDPRWVARIAGWLAGPAARSVTGRIFDVRGPEVAVVSGWHIEDVVQQLADDQELSESLLAAVDRAPLNADMTGHRPVATVPAGPTASSRR